MGVNDNFFDLGGHSLLMARLQSRLSELLGREVGMVDLFSNPTVGSLARLLSPNEQVEALQAEAEERQAGQIEVGKARLKQMRKSQRAVDI